MSESFYIDRLANIGTEVEVAGKSVRVQQITFRNQGELQAVIRKLQPRPLDTLKQIKSSLDPRYAGEVVLGLVKSDAFWPAPVASPEGIQILLGSEEGQMALLKAALAKVNNMSADEISELADNMSLAEFQTIAAIAISGEEPTASPKTQTATTEEKD